MASQKSNSNSTATTVKKPASITQKATKKQQSTSSSEKDISSVDATVPVSNSTIPKKATPRAGRKEKLSQDLPEDPVVTEVSGTPDATKIDGGSSPEAPTAAEPDVINVEKQIDDLLVRKEADRQRLKEEINLLRAMKKAYNRQIRDMRKHRKRRDVNKNGGAPRDPSGFAKESKISEELCDFLGIERGTKIARTDVTKKVIEHVKKQKLENEKENNRRNILPDAALERLVGNAEERRKTMENRKILKPKTVVTDELTYFNLQVHLNKHFISESKEQKEKEQRESIAAAANVAAASV